MSKDFRSDVVFNNTASITGNLTASVGNTFLGAASISGVPIVGTTTSQTLSNKTINAASNTISGLTDSNLSGAAGITGANLANDAVTYAKMQNVSAQYRVLGRISAAAGDVEELTPDNMVTLINQASTAISATEGGTGQTTYAVGDILYASATTGLARLADVATGNVLISGGVNTAPSWGNVGLTTHVSGTLPVANGGTGVTASTGTGSVVLNTSPTFAGTVNGAALTLSGALTASAGTATFGTTVLSRGANQTTFNADGSLTGSGSSMAAAWSTYTPTIGGFTATAGSASGRYIRVGKTVYYHIYYRFGGTPTWTGFISVSLPNSWAAFNNGVGWNASVELSSSAGARYLAHGRIPQGTGSVTVGYIGTNGVLTAPTTSAPFTWTASALLSISGFYETSAA